MAEAMKPRFARGSGSFQCLWLLVCLAWTTRVAAMPDRFAICGEEITGDKIYLVTDKVTRERKHACYDCVGWGDVCFVCGLPVRKDYVKLTDGRFLCARDAKQAVLNSDEAKRICAEVRADRDQLLSRFVT